MKRCRGSIRSSPSRSRRATTPQATPLAGQCFIVGAAPTGAWSGNASALAAFSAAGWQIVEPVNGLQAWVKSTSNLGNLSRRRLGARRIAGRVADDRRAASGRRPVGSGRQCRRRHNRRCRGASCDCCTAVSNARARVDRNRISRIITMACAIIPGWLRLLCNSTCNSRACAETAPLIMCSGSSITERV